MIYKVELTRAAIKQIASLPKLIRIQALKVAASLSENPRPHGTKAIQGRDDTFRSRIGSYRLVYQIQDNILTVLVIRVAHRKEVYQNLPRLR